MSFKGFLPLLGKFGLFDFDASGNESAIIRVTRQGSRHTRVGFPSATRAPGEKLRLIPFVFPECSENALIITEIKGKAYLYLMPKNEMNSRWIIKDLNVKTKQKNVRRKFW